MKQLVFICSFLICQLTFSQLNEKIIAKAKEAELFCQQNNMNTGFCFLVDMSIPSGKNRFFIYDFKTNSVKHSGLVCHGLGKNSTEEKCIFSNEQGSYCTSLGKYKLGAKAYSQWGINIHYKMHGLETTNSNAYKRIVVLHSHDPMPEQEIYPLYLPMGWSLGCPVVSNNLMKEIDHLLKKENKSTLIWIFN